MDDRFLGTLEESPLTVITPAADMAHTLDVFEVHVGYEADIVTGATEWADRRQSREATDFHDTRQQFAAAST